MHRPVDTNQAAECPVDMLVWRAVDQETGTHVDWAEMAGSDLLPWLVQGRLWLSWLRLRHGLAPRSRLECDHCTAVQRSGFTQLYRTAKRECAPLCGPTRGHVVPICAFAFRRRIPILLQESLRQGGGARISCPQDLQAEGGVPSVPHGISAPRFRSAKVW